MIKRVTLLVYMNEYRAQAWEIHDDHDYECLYFDINEDDLLEDLESVCMVDTHSSSNKEQSSNIDYRDSKQDRNAVLEATQALLAHP